MPYCESSTCKTRAGALCRGPGRSRGSPCPGRPRYLGHAHGQRRRTILEPVPPRALPPRLRHGPIAGGHVLALGRAGQSAPPPRLTSRRAPPRALMAMSRSPSRRLPRGPRLNRAAPTHAAAPAGRGGRLRGPLPGEGRKLGDTRSAGHCQESSRHGARTRGGKDSGGGGFPGRPRDCAAKGARRPCCFRAARAALPQHGGAGAPLPQTPPISTEAWRKPARSRPMGGRRGRGRRDSGGTG